MAVYERGVGRYTGRLTAPSTRFLVLPRYVLKDVFASKLLTFFFAICFLVPTFFLAAIYIRYNAEALSIFEIDLEQFISVDATLFYRFLTMQGVLAFALTLFVGPGLISRDLVNNGLPLYLSRPISRGEYVLGKLTVLAGLLSAITWVSAFVLVAIQGNLADGWLAENLRIVPAVFVGSWVLIVLLGTSALAFSAWLKWRPVAAFLMLMFVLTGSFFAFLISALFRTEYGQVVSPSRLIRIVWASLLGVRPPPGPPAWVAWTALAMLAAFFLWVLHRKIRAYEVVS